MPIYVFRCDDCGEKFERLQKLSDPDPDICPNCGKRHVRRQVTAPAFRLAGSGWYETDFKSDKEKKHNLAGDGAKPDSVGSKPVEVAKGGEAGKETAKPAAAEKPAKAAGD
ncbi:MAG: FmdB family zinc ribbon protein [Rhodanobacteraceae bacterium]